MKNIPLSPLALPIPQAGFKGGIKQTAICNIMINN
jgi:hypothetical protein